MVDLDDYMPASWRVFVTWLDGFSSQWKGSCDHPPLLSSLDFLCCELTSAFFFSHNVPNC